MKGNLRFNKFQFNFSLIVSLPLKGSFTFLLMPLLWRCFCSLSLFPKTLHKICSFWVRFFNWVFVRFEMSTADIPVHWIIYAAFYVCCDVIRFGKNATLIYCCLAIPQTLNKSTYYPKINVTTTNCHKATASKYFQSLWTDHLVYDHIPLYHSKHTMWLQYTVQKKPLPTS